MKDDPSLFLSSPSKLRWDICGDYEKLLKNSLHTMALFFFCWIQSLNQTKQCIFISLIVFCSERRLAWLQQNRQQTFLPKGLKRKNFVTDNQELEVEDNFKCTFCQDRSKYS